jgi:hypothetical protein
MTSPTRKITKFVDYLTNLCKENITADLRSLHGSLMFSGNKIISSGYNSLSHEGIFGRHTKAEHAEVAVCRKYSNMSHSTRNKYCLLRSNT